MQKALRSKERSWIARGRENACLQRAELFCRNRNDHFVGVTTPTLSTPLHAMYTRPSDVAAILRTTPPPEGILALANVCVFGLNWTIVFGCTPDSLYQTIPSGVIAIP